jgi:hypothetical protein
VRFDVRRLIGWPPLWIAIAIFIAGTTFVDRYRIMPPELAIAIRVAMFILVVTSTICHAFRAAPQLQRNAAIGYAIGLTIATMLYFWTVLSKILGAGNIGRGIELLESSLAVWLMNVLTFALWYWLIDSQWLRSRSGEVPSKHLLFPQAGHPDFPRWAASFGDYLALSFTTATAFSPTDVLPASVLMKMLMLVEASLSLAIIAIAASRAIGALG